jgi:enoyl-CoA hydratase/carnithine racemase
MMLVDFTLDGDLAVVFLNDVPRRNALSAELVADLLAVFDEPSLKAARAVIIGAHGPAFCAGADITGLLANGWMEADGGRCNPLRVFERLSQHPRPVIAAVTGAAFGGGFELMLSCDLALAGSDAVFALPEAAHGVLPNTGLAVLGAMIGRRRAYELAVTGRRLSAREAEQLGLVNGVVPAAAVLEAAKALARQIVGSAAPGALGGIKQALATHAPLDWSAVQASLAALPREQWQEGLGAFVARRAPDYERFWCEATDAHRDRGETT